MRGIGLPFAAALLLSGNAAIAKPKATGPFTKYQCTRIEKLPTGDIWATVWADRDRKPLSHVALWIPGRPASRFLRMTVRWEAHPPATIDWNKGIFMFDREFEPDVEGRRRVLPKLTMELRANREPPWQGQAVLRDNFKLQFGVRLSAEWGDVSDMAQNHRPLYLVIRSRGKVVETLTIAPDHLAPPTGRIEELFRGANADLLEAGINPDKCEDLEHTDILI